MVRRRALLAALGAAVGAGLAGCNALLDGDENDQPTGREPTTTPTATPTATLTPTPTGGTKAGTPPGTPPGTATTAGTAAPTATTTPTPTLSPTAVPTTSPLPETVGDPTVTPAGSNPSHFGRAVGLSGEYALVAASDGAYVYAAADGWDHAATLTPGDGDSFGGWGLSAALSGDVAVVGSPNAGPETRKGAMYLFEAVGDQWRQRYRFETGNTDEEHDEFGKSVAFDGDRVVVGDVQDPGTMVSWIGNAYVFAGDGDDWTREAVLETGDHDLFGTSVALDGDTLLVGAPAAEPDRETGAVYEYERADGEWRQRAVLSPDDLSDHTWFGWRVALDGDNALVSAFEKDPPAVYVFERDGDGWAQRGRFTGTGTEPGDDFGAAVSIAGDVAVLGAPGYEESGRAHLLRRDGEWREAAALVPDDPPNSADFGAAVAVDGNTALVGAPQFAVSSAASLFDV